MDLKYNWDIHEDYNLLKEYRKFYPPIYELVGSYCIHGFKTTHIRVEQMNYGMIYDVYAYDEMKKDFVQIAVTYHNIEQIEDDIQIE